VSKIFEIEPEDSTAEPDSDGVIKVVSTTSNVEDMPHGMENGEGLVKSWSQDDPIDRPPSTKESVEGLNLVGKFLERRSEGTPIAEPFTNPSDAEDGFAPRNCDQLARVNSHQRNDSLLSSCEPIPSITKLSLVTEWVNQTEAVTKTRPLSRAGAKPTVPINRNYIEQDDPYYSSDAWTDDSLYLPGCGYTKRSRLRRGKPAMSRRAEEQPYATERRPNDRGLLPIRTGHAGSAKPSRFTALYARAE